MKHLLLLPILFVLTSCATQKKIELDKLKEEDRIYTGNLQVTLDGKTNKDLTCDVFMNIDLNPMFRLAADGNYDFKTPRSKLDLAKIVCLYKDKSDGKKYWISHDFDFKKIKKQEDENTITTLGVVNVDWKIREDQISKPPTKFAADMDERIENIGKFKVTSMSNAQAQATYIQNKFPELKDAKYKVIERVFEKTD